MGYALFQNEVIGKGKIMENNQLVALQAKRDELVKAIKDKQKEIDWTDPACKEFKCPNCGKTYESFVPKSCCDKEQREFAGGCKNCGDPAI